MLSGLLRCHACAGALGWQKDYYRCRKNTKARALCPNNAGIPAAQAERFVIAAVVKLLREDQEAAADVIEARQARERAKVATFGDPRADALAEAATKKRKLANLLALAEEGEAGADVLDRIKAPRAEIETLKATPEPVRPFDRAAFVATLPTVSRQYTTLLRFDGREETTRAALKRLGISKLIATLRPGAKGLWDLTGRMDLEKTLGEVYADDAAEIPNDLHRAIYPTVSAEVIALWDAETVGSQGERVG